jgi:hypothetical protein
MKEEKLSRRQDRMLFKALESVVLTQFPNPERKGCPGTDVLRLIARKKLAMRDPVHEHVGECSPCFSELLELRATIRRKRTLKAATGAMVIVLAGLAGYYTFQSPGLTTRTVTPAVPLSDSVSLDLRDFQTTRSESTAPGTQPSTIPLVPRGRLALTIYLPIGSLEGQYEVQIENTGRPSLAAGLGNAVIENNITTLHVNLDTTSIPEGEYRLGLRQTGLSWRQYPIVIR